MPSPTRSSPNSSTPVTSSPASLTPAWLPPWRPRCGRWPPRRGDPSRRLVPRRSWERRPSEQRRVVRGPAAADLRPDRERRADPGVQEQVAGRALDGQQVVGAVMVAVADTDDVAHAVPAGANAHPVGQATVSGARVEPEVAVGPVPGNKVGVAVPGEVTDSHELVHGVPTGPDQAPGTQGCAVARVEIC